MTTTERTVKLGRLEELKAEEHELSVIADTMVKTIFDNMTPIDEEKAYLSRIDAPKLRTCHKVLQENLAKLKKLRKEIQLLKEDLGLNGENG